MSYHELPPDFPQPPKLTEGIFIKSENLPEEEVEVFDIKRMKLMQVDVIMEEVETCRIQKSESDSCRHVHFTPDPPQEFPTFTNEEYDRKSVSPTVLRGIDYYSLWQQKQQLDLHFQFQ